MVLPEVFNTGYEYTEHNYELAETMDGETVVWMKAQANTHGVHLAGSLLLLDGDHVYNSALLFAPDGRMWRYDKNYPFLWERAYFREGRGITIADTDLGKLGIMICWDTAHPDMWERYAGNVDAMVVTSCPPKISSSDFVFPDGTRSDFRQFGPLIKHMYTEEEYFPGVDMDEHAAWMGVPVVNTVGGGKFSSPLPLPSVSLGTLIAGNPALWDKLADAKDVRVEASFDKQTKIVGADGQVAARVTEEGDGFVLAEVELPDETPQPVGEQPAMRTSPMAYFSGDIVGNVLLSPVYRQGLRRQRGEHMAPLDYATKVWTAALIVVALFGWLMGRRKKSRVIVKRGK